MTGPHQTGLFSTTTALAAYQVFDRIFSMDRSAPEKEMAPPVGLEPTTNNYLALSYLLRGNRLKRHDAMRV